MGLIDTKTTDTKAVVPLPFITKPYPFRALYIQLNFFKEPGVSMAKVIMLKYSGEIFISCLACPQQPKASV